MHYWIFIFVILNGYIYFAGFNHMKVIAFTAVLGEHILSYIRL